MLFLLLFSVLVQKGSTATASPPTNSEGFQCSYEFKKDKEKYSNMMKCASNTICLPTFMICNGNEDCEDGSDEANCDGDPEDREIQKNRVLCKRDEYRCADDSGKCIPLNQTCDGIVHCPIGDDEYRERCRDCARKNCAHKCRISDYESQCDCPDGSTLNDDGRTCSPIDFCQTAGGRRCQQYCKGDRTGYQCSCAENYFLAEDGHGCHLQRKNDIQFIVTIGDKQVVTVPLLNDSAQSDIYFEHKYMRPDADYLYVKDDPHYPKGYEQQMGYRRSIAYNNHNNIAYLTANEFARQADLIMLVNNTEKIMRRELVGPAQIAVEYVGGNFFYTQTHHSEPGIYVCTEDALFCRRIVAGKEVTPWRDYQHFHEKVMENGTRKLTAFSQTRLFLSGALRQYYSGIALNPFTGKMVYVDIYDDTKLMMANMDGSDITELYNNGKDYLSAPTFDPIKNEVYFASWKSITIVRINLNTMELHTVVSQGMGAVTELQYFDGYLYWVGWYPKALKFARVRNQNCTGEILRYFDQEPREVAIKHPHYQPMPAENPCTQMANSCPWICVIVPGSEPNTIQGKCICPDNYKEEDGLCLPDKNITKKKHVHLLEAHSYVDVEYWKELCSKGTACLNGGQCAEIGSNDTVGDTYCNCPAPFIGERCELADPKRPWSWIAFWILSFLLLVAVGGFGFFYYRDERIRELTRTTLRRLTRRNDLPEARFILDETGSGSRNAPTVSFSSPLFGA